MIHNGTSVLIGLIQGGEKREAAKVFNIEEDTIYRWLRRAKAGDLKPKKRTEFPRKVSDKTLGAYVREHPHRTLRKISQAVGLAVSNVHRHLKNGGDFKKTTLYAERCPQKRAHFQEELAQLNPDTVALWMKPGLIIGFFAFTLERPEVRKLRQMYRGKTRTSQYDWRLYAKEVHSPLYL